MWNFALQLLKTFYLHYHIVYGHQAWQGCDLSWGTLAWSGKINSFWVAGLELAVNFELFSNFLEISQFRIILSFWWYLRLVVKGKCAKTEKSANICWWLSTTTMSMATKLGRVETYHEVLPPIKSCNPSTAWSCKITWQTKTITSPLPQCLWRLNLAGWWRFMKSSHT